MRGRILAVVLLLVLVMAGCTNTQSVPANSESIHADSEEPGIADEKDTSDTNSEIKETPGFDTVELSEVPSGLESFLANFAWFSAGKDYKGFNCEEQEGVVGLMDLFWGPMMIYTYPVDPETGVTSDGYSRFDAEKSEWVLQNVYNCSEKTIERLRDGSLCPSVEYDGSEYVTYAGGVGGGYQATLLQAMYNGTIYSVTYDIYYDSFDEGYLPLENNKTHYAWLEYREYDGNGYWSILRDSLSPIDESGMPEEENNGKSEKAIQAVNAFLAFLDSSGPDSEYSLIKGVWNSSELRYQLAYINNDDIPELIIDNPGYYAGIYYYEEDGSVKEVFCESYGTWGNFYSFLEKKDYVINTPYGEENSDDGNITSSYTYYYPVIDNNKNEYYKKQSTLYKNDGTSKDLGIQYYCKDGEISKQEFEDAAKEYGFDNDRTDISGLKQYTKNEIKEQLGRFVYGKE